MKPLRSIAEVRRLRAERRSETVVVQFVCRHVRRTGGVSAPQAGTGSPAVVAQYTVVVRGRSTFLNPYAVVFTGHHFDEAGNRLDAYDVGALAERTATTKHQLHCVDCDYTERLQQSDLERIVRWAALLDTPSGRDVELRSIRRILNLLD